MFMEIARFEVQSDTQDDFERDFTKVVEALSHCEGFGSVELRPSADHPLSYIVLFTWESHEHLRAFRDSGAADSIRGIVEPYFAGQVDARDYGENIAPEAA